MQNKDDLRICRDKVIKTGSDQDKVKIFLSLGMQV